MTRRVLVARLDSDGDVLLAGPAIRAVAAAPHTEVTLLCGPAGAQAARLLPGVGHMLVWHCPWLAADPDPVSPKDIDGLVARLTGFDLAVVLISADYPGTLLDVRLRPDLDFTDDAPEPLRALAVANAAGCLLPAGDDGTLRILPNPDVTHLVGDGPYLVLHPGATVPARRWPADRCAAAVRALTDAGHRVLVTGDPGEKDLTAEVAGDSGVDLGGMTGYAGVLCGADAVVVGNTGPTHLAAAVGTPVVSLSHQWCRPRDTPAFPRSQRRTWSRPYKH